MQTIVTYHWGHRSVRRQGNAVMQQTGLSVGHCAIDIAVVAVDVVTVVGVNISSGEEVRFLFRIAEKERFQTIVGLGVGSSAL